MDWLNYHHLLYFWTVAKEGSITKASQTLRLAPSTVSVQIKTLEESLGIDLFERRGRRLVLTDAGRIAFGYAEEIFDLGQELLDTFHARPTGKTSRLTVGITDVLWKDIAKQLLAPTAQLENPIRLTCVEGSFENLLADMAVHHVDVVLSDTPLGSAVGVKAFNHLLGKSGISFYATKSLAEKGRANFPTSLGEVPMLLPTKRNSLRRHLEQWFESVNVRPWIVGEFDDSALMTAFGTAGDGVFPAPSVIEFDLMERNTLEKVGEAEKVQQRFYAISPERRIKLKGVQAICDVARQDVFS